MSYSSDLFLGSFVKPSPPFPPYSQCGGPPASLVATTRPAKSDDPFEFEADRGLFAELLCREGETLDDYAQLFDFDPPAVKRASFAKIRGDILRQRLAEHGEVCQLRIHAQCDVSTGLQIDHVIPLFTV